MELSPSEYVVKERIPANLFKSVEAVGGRLTITNERLLFTPHMINRITSYNVCYTKLLRDDVLDQMKSHGYNLIRLPYSNQMFDSRNNFV